jgi:hypothetical protein
VRGLDEDCGKAGVSPGGAWNMVCERGCDGDCVVLGGGGYCVNSILQCDVKVYRA